MPDEHDRVYGRVAGTIGRGRLAFAVLGGIGAWVLHLTASYAFVPFVCATDRGFLLHLLTGGFALVAAAATWMGWKIWRGLDPRSEVEVARNADSRIAVARFLALAGFLMSAFFLFLILGEGLPALLQGDPCRHVPTLDQPIIWLDPGWTPALALLNATVRGSPGGR